MIQLIKSLQRKELFWLIHLLESPYIGILIVDREYRCVLANNRLCNMFGYTKEMLIGNSVEKLYLDDISFTTFIEQSEKNINSGNTYKVDYEVKRSTGEHFWVHAAGDLIEETGEILWTFVDITDRIRAKEEMLYMKERLELAIEANREVVWDWDLVNKELYVTDVWKEIVGHDASQTPYKIEIWKKHIHPQDKKALFRDIQNNLTGRTPYIDNVHRLRHSSGEWIWIHLRGKTIFNSEGRAIRAIGTHRNITHEKEMEQKIARQARIIEQIHDSVISVSLDGHILSWNNGSKVLFGYSASEMVGEHIRILFPSQKEYYAFTKEIQHLLHGDEFSIEITLMRKSGDEVFVNFSLSILTDDDGKTIGYIGYAQDITDKKRVEREILKQKSLLHHQATHDMLTGLPNRLAFHMILEDTIELARKHRYTMALLFIDLDHFKEINDSLGHDIGDLVLREVTAKLQNVLKRSERLFRLGGDEFTVIMQKSVTRAEIERLAQKIIETLEIPMVIEDHELYVSCSIGISCYPDDALDGKKLLQYADAAMYQVKTEGKGSFHFYRPEMTQKLVERVVLESRLRDAIKNAEFSLCYQPQLNARTGKMIGIEALVRWYDPQKGRVMPDRFIPLAESTGLIVPLGIWIMQEAMSQLVRWYEAGYDPGILMINLSVKQIEEKGFLDHVEQILKKTGCNPRWLEFELTESQIMKDTKESIAVLDRLNRMGIALAIDDFGTGYSSLSYLKRLPLQKLKIDRSFVKELPSCKEDVAICQAIIALGKSLQLDLIAEGVETEEQKQFLLSCGCENIQGYYYAKPLASDEMTRFLQHARHA